MMLYIAYECIWFGETLGTSGVWKKIMGQANAFKKKFGKIYVTFLYCQMAYLMDGKEIVEKEAAITRRDYLKILVSWIDKYMVKRTYIRYPFADKWFVELLRYQRENGIKTVFEIASYPYEEELAYGRRKVEDACYRKMASGYVDMIATYSCDRKIWEKPCINLVNGISLENIPLKKRRDRDGKIVLIAVSTMAPWHGFERMLEGMHNYYQAGGGKEILFKLVGIGGQLDYYKMLTEKYHLEARVEFCGMLEGDVLTQQFDMSDIAIGSLGTYKAGVMEASPIKGAEYCARGIPMVFGYKDMRFSDDTQFVLRVSNDATAIDINRIIGFFEGIVLQNDFRQSIREFAIQHLTWESIMQPVIDRLQ